MKTVKIIKKILITTIITNCAIPTINQSAALPPSIKERAAALKEARDAAIPAEEQSRLNKELMDTLYLRDDDPSRVQVLLDQGADPDAINEVNGYSALLVAISRKKTNLLQLLISAGADLNTQLMPPGTTALMRITSNLITQNQPDQKKINQKIMNILIKAGADLNVQDYCGTTVLMQTIERPWSPPPYIINLLIKAGADINVKNIEKQDVRQLANQAITHHQFSPEAIAACETLDNAIKARDRATQECARTWRMRSQNYLMEQPLPISPLVNIMQEYAQGPEEIPTSCDPVAIAKQRSIDATIRQLERAEETLERAIIFRSIAAEQGIEAAQAWALATKRRT